MPELPEVETICWRLREGGQGEPPLVGRRIVDVVLTDERVWTEGDAASVREALRGAGVLDVQRRAKWIDVVTDRAHLIVHLRMTGDLHLVPAGDVRRFERFALVLDDDTRCVFTDPRRLGTACVMRDPRALFAPLGPEPLSSSFDVSALHAALRGARTLKAALMDQARIAGIGNIQADEILFDARLHPTTPIAALHDDDVARLHASIQRVLRDAIAHAKEELAWRYANRGTPSPFAVYERAGRPCRRCGTMLSSMKSAGRTSVFCAQCQPLHPVRAGKQRTARPT